MYRPRSSQDMSLQVRSGCTLVSETWAPLPNTWTSPWGQAPKCSLFQEYMRGFCLAHGSPLGAAQSMESNSQASVPSAWESWSGLCRCVPRSAGHHRHLSKLPMTWDYRAMLTSPGISTAQESLILCISQPVAKLEHARRRDAAAACSGMLVRFNLLISHINEVSC